MNYAEAEALGDRMKSFTEEGLEEGLAIENASPMWHSDWKHLAKLATLLVHLCWNTLRT